VDEDDVSIPPGSEAHIPVKWDRQVSADTVMIPQLEDGSIGVNPGLAYGKDHTFMRSVVNESLEEIFLERGCPLAVGHEWIVLKALKEKKAEVPHEQCFLARGPQGPESSTLRAGAKRASYDLEAMAPQSIGEEQDSLVLPNEQHVDQILKAATELLDGRERAPDHIAVKNDVGRDSSGGRDPGNGGAVLNHPLPVVISKMYGVQADEEKGGAVVPHIMLPAEEEGRSQLAVLTSLSVLVLSRDTGGVLLNG
jgi:hypothetical protein